MNTARNESTCETCPCHIWMHEVVMAAGALGADDADLIRAQKPRLLTWYRAGEPVWMAAESLAFAVKQGRKEIVAERKDDSLRRILREAVIR